MASGKDPNNGSTKASQKAGRTFLKDLGYGPERLAAVTSRIDWSRPDALARARDAIALYAATVRELVRDAARGRRRQPGTFLNDLVPTLDPSEWPPLWLAVRPALDAEPAAWQGLSAATRATLEQAGTALASHLRLLRDGTLPAPRLADIAAIDTDTLLALYVRQLRESGETATPAGTLKLLKFIGQRHDAAGDNRATLLRRLRALRKSLDDAPAPLDHAGFRTLPASERRELLFAPGLAHAFLDAQAQAAARPPSPAYDLLYLDRALENLARGTLDHVDVDTLFLGGSAATGFRAKIVTALAHGSGRLECDQDVVERLVAGADIPELCLVACAAAAAPEAMRRALARLPQLPDARVLGEALLRFALIAWQSLPLEHVPPAFRDHPAFRARHDRGAALTENDA